MYEVRMARLDAGARLPLDLVRLRELGCPHFLVSVVAVCRKYFCPLVKS